MKWESHKKITGVSAKIAGLPKDVVKLLTESSVLPDVDPDFETKTVKKGNKVIEKKYRMNHHGNPKTKKLIFSYLSKARKKYKKNDLKWTEDFGRAAHYIQDYVVNVYRKVFFVFRKKDMRIHNRFEDRLTRVELPYEHMKKTYNDIWYPSKFRNFIEKELKMYDEPEEAMKKASIMTAAALKLIIDPQVPLEIYHNYNKWRAIFFATTIPSAIAVVASILISNTNLLAISIIVFGVCILNPIFWKYYQDVHW